MIKSHWSGKTTKKGDWYIYRTWPWVHLIQTWGWFITLPVSDELPRSWEDTFALLHDGLEKLWIGTSVVTGEPSVCPFAGLLEPLHCTCLIACSLATVRDSKNSVKGGKPYLLNCYSLTPELMEKWILLMIWPRQFHRLSTHCALCVGFVGFRMSKRLESHLQFVSHFS